MRKHIFNAGPAVLPREVLEEASLAVTDFKQTGQSILEISHRSDHFVTILEQTREMIKRLYKLGNDYEVLLMQGGASSQFAMIPMNFLDKHERAAYVDTGVWSAKAIKEAKTFGHVEIVASSAGANYAYIPKNFRVPEDARYLHITSNNTVYGSQYFDFPRVHVPLIADMSSDIFSREIDLTQFHLVYAGAQKNAGTAGVTIVIIKKDFLKCITKEIPAIFDYRQWVASQSLYNTPCVFGIYVCYLVMQWLTQQGGLRQIERVNRQKAQLLYEAIDKSKIFDCPVAKEDRSMMNVVFFISAEKYFNATGRKLGHTAKEVGEAQRQLENKFLELAAACDIVGIKGHRLAGGFRASLYNALPLESVLVLIKVIEQFEDEVFSN